MAQKYREMHDYNVYPSYKGGDTCVNCGYIFEYLPDQYPHLQNMWGWIAQHRVIGEDIVGRKLAQSKDPKLAECVHHKNEVRTDNSLENLEVMTMCEHRSHHAKKMAETMKSPIDEAELKRCLETMTIKGTARHLGVHHMTIRNRFPHLIAHKKRVSPEKIDDPQIIETVLFFAPNPNYGTYEVEQLTKISIRSILRICKKNKINWVHKTRTGRPPKPSQP